MEVCIYTIGAEAMIDVIGDKWRPTIPCNLRHGAMRPSGLKRGTTGTSQKMPTQQLWELEEDNTIERKVYNQVPPEIEYYLSDYSQSPSTVLDNLCNWGRSHVAHLQGQGQEIYLKCEDQ